MRQAVPELVAPPSFIRASRLAPLAVVTLLLAGCGRSELSKERAIRAAAAAAKQQVQRRVVVRRADERKTRNGYEDVWLVRFAIVPRGQICVLSWRSQAAYNLYVPYAHLVYDYFTEPAGQRIWTAIGTCADTDAVLIQ